MYHGGHILGLIEAGLYEHIHVVSGTSGGAIMAAMFGCKTRVLRTSSCPTSRRTTKRDGAQSKRAPLFLLFCVGSRSPRNVW